MVKQCRVLGFLSEKSWGRTNDMPAKKLKTKKKGYVHAAESKNSPYLWGHPSDYTRMTKIIRFRNPGNSGWQKNKEKETKKNPEGYTHTNLNKQTLQFL